MGKGVADDSVGTGGEDDYYWSYTDEPHASRRKAILQKYPQIKELQGHDPNTKYWVVLAVCTQVYIATRVEHWNWWWFAVFTYVVGGTIVQYLTLAIHEISHNLLFKSPLANRLFGFFANSPLLFGYSYTFRRYHMEHHKWQGEQDVDMDVPTAAEGRIVGNSRFMKTLWVANQFWFYALRPVLMKPLPISRWEVYNWLYCIAFDAALFYYFGVWPFVYLFASMIIGLGPHPLAGHFVAEHYVFTPGTETYSYYGPLNFLSCWVGLHVAHHDFARIPGSRLHKVEEIAPEYYAHLPQYTSWSKVLWDYVMREDMSPFSRMMRNTRKNKAKAAKAQ